MSTSVRAPRPAALALVASLLPCACNLDIFEAVGDPEGDDDEAEDDTSETETSGESGSEDNMDESGDGDPDSFRVVVLADPHVIGPNYFGEDESLLMAKARLETTRQQIAAIDPPPAFAIVLGDLVHAAYASPDASWYADNPNAFAEVDALLEGFPIPVYPLFGESDYAVPDLPKTLSHQLFIQYFAREPYYAIEHQGWRFVFANSQLGPSFEPLNMDFDPSTGSFGQAQLDWLATELGDGRPTVLLTHFPLFQILLDEAPGAVYPDLVDLVAASPNVELVLSGHLHQWNSQPQQFGAPHFAFGATRYDSDNFLLIEFNLDGTLVVLDANKPDWGTPNADTWSYQGTPAPSE